MKYYKTSKFTKAITSTGFITMAACALIAIGAITWFALSKNNVSETPQNNTSDSSYNTQNNSYNSDVTSQETTDVNDQVSDIPYVNDESSTQNTSSVNEIEETTFVLPVTGNISKNFSDTVLQYSATYGDMRLHTGIDVLCSSGTNIKSASDGTVKSVTEDANLGRIITIEHTKNITVKYCGMGSVNVTTGDKVTAGDIIGTSGNIPSECADKPHIHIEVIVDEKHVSPLAALGFE